MICYKFAVCALYSSHSIPVLKFHILIKVICCT
nr:MAG TPA: hypothetical protein [Caudoviricetes sp.]